MKLIEVDKTQAVLTFHKMPGGRKKNIKKRKQEEESSKKRFFSNQGMSAEHWPGGEPINSPEKEMGARAKECCVCQARSNTKKCSGCYSAWFCGLECQKKAWPEHKKECKVGEVNLSVLNLFQIFSMI